MTWVGTPFNETQVIALRVDDGAQAGNSRLYNQEGNYNAGEDWMKRIARVFGLRSLVFVCFD
jgi:hypothetical protein